MARKIKNKPGAGRTFFLSAVLFILAVLGGGYLLYTGLYPDDIRFNYIVITKNNSPLKILRGETVKFHPSDICKIQEISTNVYFNHGVRIVSTGMDVNSLLYDETVLEKLLPDNDIFNHYEFSVEIKYQADVIGKINLIIEPTANDWIDKAIRSIGSERKIKMLEKALKSGFDEKPITNMLVDEYIAAKEWDKAAILLEKNAKDSVDQEYLTRLLELYETVKNTKKVISTLKRLIKLSPDDISLKYKLAEIYGNSNKIDSAIKEYKSLISLVPKEDLGWIHKEMGYLYTKKKWPKTAIKSYLKALELDKEDINLYYNLAELYERTGNRARAEKYLTMAVDMKSDDIESRLKLSENLIKKNYYTKAQKYLNQIIKRNPDSLDAWLLFARIEEKRGNKTALKKHYKKIMSIAPDNKTVIFNMGVLEFETGNLNNAKKYFNQYLKKSPSDIDSREFLFDIYRKQKNDKSAFLQVDKILNKKPEKKQYYGFIFDYLNKTKNFKLMFKVMDRGYKISPDNSEIGKYLIIASLKTGKEKSAISLIKKGLKIKPEDVSTLMQLAALYEKLGQLNDALDIYKEVLVLSPENKKAQESYLRLRLEVLE